MTWLGVSVLVLLGFLLDVDLASAQCAMCRQALESSETTRALALHLNNGILVLLAAPAGVVVTIGVAMRRAKHRSVE